MPDPANMSTTIAAANEAAAKALRSYWHVLNDPTADMAARLALEAAGVPSLIDKADQWDAAQPTIEAMVRVVVAAKAIHRPAGREWTRVEIALFAALDALAALDPQDGDG